MGPMSTAIFRFYEELNDFLPKERRKTDFEVKVKGNRPIKELIEILGVPHTEIDLILVNGEPVDLEYTPRDGDRVSVYPVFESFNIKNVTRLRKIPLRKTRFIADNDLRDMVAHMKAMGLDVYFNSSLSPMEIIEISENENRIILTRDIKLLKLEGVTHGILLHSDTKDEQLKEIINLLDIKF